jgi:hypothetical protein
MGHAIVKLVGGQKKWHRGRHLAAERCGEPKELTRGDRGSRRKLAAACRNVSHHAAVAWREGNIFRKIRTQGNCGPQTTSASRKMIHCVKVARQKEHGLLRQEKDDIALSIPKGWMSRIAKLEQRTQIQGGTCVLISRGHQKGLTRRLLNWSS